MSREELTELQFWEAMDKTTIESLSIIQRTPTKPSDYKTFRLSSNANFPLSTKLWRTSTNNLIQKWQNQKIIAYLLGTSINIESARETFYNKLIQNTSLPTNYNFAFIITEINKEIEYYTQQRYLITYANKVELPTNPSYYYIPRSAINITSIGAFTATATLAFRKFPFQTSSWEITELEGEQEEEKEKESEDQEFTYQNPITENSEFETPNSQTQPNLNPENPEIETPNIQTLSTQDNRNPETIN
ncbi:hypothetical protein G9A89_003391 [Geosiphon pyriformis]|nr:hypothetical protein G9A89_003391 [Geosiphon pyriformis]